MVAFGLHRRSALGDVAPLGKKVAAKGCVTRVFAALAAQEIFGTAHKKTTSRDCGSGVCASGSTLPSSAGRATTRSWSPSQRESSTWTPIRRKSDSPRWCSAASLWPPRSMATIARPSTGSTATAIAGEPRQHDERAGGEIHVEELRLALDQGRDQGVVGYALRRCGERENEESERRERRAHGALVVEVDREASVRIAWEIAGVGVGSPSRIAVAPADELLRNRRSRG